MGQLKAIAQTFFNQTLQIEVKDTEIVFDTIHVSFQVPSFSHINDFNDQISSQP